MPHPVTLILFAIACFFSRAVVASTESEQVVGPIQKSDLDGSLSLGVLSTTGNTDTSTFKARLELKKNLTDWLHYLEMDGLYKEGSVVNDLGDRIRETTAQKYFISFQSAYKLRTEDETVFMIGSYTRDKFSGFDYQGTIATGYGNSLFRTDKNYLKINIGPGFHAYKTRTDDPLTAIEVVKHPVIYLSCRYYY